MNYLPDHSGLPIEILSGCFRNRTNSYKFYWFLAILEHLGENKDNYISFRQLTLSMLSAAWYPLTYYKLSFGKQDSFKNLAIEVSKHLVVDCSPKSEGLKEQMTKNLNATTLNKLERHISETLKRWVAYRFLRPFFRAQLKATDDSDVNEQIRAYSEANPGYIPYCFSKDGITIDPTWAEYFQTNKHILKGFIQWQLVKFLQSNNPNIIGLSEKLNKPIERDLKKVTKYWQQYIKANPINCVYSKKPLDPTSISMDHFVPWSYIAHDQIWNIIPTSKAINSSKSNILPSTSLYLATYSKLQFSFVQFFITSKDNQILEDYRVLFKTNNLHEISYESFHLRLEEEINMHCRSAANLGFGLDYVWNSKI
jgi:hypothetical protein